MSGVTEITANSLTDGCDLLGILVINGNLTIGNGVFYSATASGVADVYLTSANNITYSASDNSLLSGNFYVYSANKVDCVKSWWYGESGDFGKSEGTENHSFDDGVCSKCGLTLNKQTLTETYNLDLTNANETLKVSALDGNVENIKVGETTFAATYDKANGVIKASISGVTTGKEVTVKITTSTTIYTLTAKTWDKVISNATELQSLLNIFNAVTTEPANSNGYTKGYYCLDADIDATSVTSTANKTVFCGTLDGQGHTVSNFTAPQGGIVKAFTTTGKFCNIAFKACTGTECFFADHFAGALSNVYAEVTITPKNSRYGLIRRMKEYNSSDKIRVENCVFIVNKATAAGSEVGGIVAKCDPDKNAVADIFKNVHLINNTESKFVSDGTNEKDLTSATTVRTYTSQTTFAGEEITFSADDGWATYWKLEEGKLFFGDNQMI